MISHKPKKERAGKKATDTYSCSIALQNKKGSEVYRQNSTAPQVNLTLFTDLIDQVERVVYGISKSLE